MIRLLNCKRNEITQFPLVEISYVHIIEDYEQSQVLREICKYFP